MMEWIVALLALVIGAFSLGKTRGKRAERREAERKDAGSAIEVRKATQTIERKHNDTVPDLSDDDLTDRLRRARRRDTDD